MHARLGRHPIQPLVVWCGCANYVRYATYGTLVAQEGDGRDGTQEPPPPYTLPTTYLHARTHVLDTSCAPLHLLISSSHLIFILKKSSREAGPDRVRVKKACHATKSPPFPPSSSVILFLGSWDWGSGIRVCMQIFFLRGMAVEAGVRGGGEGRRRSRRR